MATEQRASQRPAGASGLPGADIDWDAKHHKIYTQFANMVLVQGGRKPIEDLHALQTGIPLIWLYHLAFKNMPLPKYNKKADTNEFVQKANVSVAMDMYDTIIERNKSKAKRMLSFINLKNSKDPRMFNNVLGAMFHMIEMAGITSHGPQTNGDPSLEWFQDMVTPYGQHGRPANWRGDMRNPEIWSALHHACTNGNPGKWDHYLLQNKDDSSALNESFQGFEDDMCVKRMFSGEDVMTQGVDKKMFVTYVTAIRMAVRFRMQEDYSRRAKELLSQCAEQVEHFQDKTGDAETLAQQHIHELKGSGGDWHETETCDLVYLHHEIKMDTAGEWKCEPELSPEVLEMAFNDYRKAKDGCWQKIREGLKALQAKS